MFYSDDPAAQAAFAEVFAESAAAERTRIAAIMDGDAAKTRPVLARRLALTTDMSADAAQTFMADLPAEAKADPGAVDWEARRAAWQAELDEIDARAARNAERAGRTAH